MRYFNYNINEKVLGLYSGAHSCGDSIKYRLITYFVIDFSIFWRITYHNNSYANHDVFKKIDLWKDIYSISQKSMGLSWLVKGDFNVIMNDYEKIDGLTVYSYEHEYF